MKPPLLLAETLLLMETLPWSEIFGTMLFFGCRNTSVLCCLVSTGTLWEEWAPRSSVDV